MSEEASKILYFDPNNISFSKDAGNNLNAIFKGPTIMKDPEDYSIAVDLEVVMKDRDNVVIIDALKATNSGESSIHNLLEGKNLAGTNVLTTYFTDITNTNTGEYDNEALSIASIDIEFTSWYVASVIIKFTDVRGAGMFSQAEYNNSNKNGSNNQNQFAPFFTMPYPIFNLKVKGFYGNAVTYPLHCTDFQAEFNNEKGNFDITAQFIGYTYAMLSDIQMSYLIAAPYLKQYGEAYWARESAEGGRFRTLEGRPLPKIPELMYRVADGMQKQGKLDNSNSNIVDLKVLDNQTADILALETNLQNYCAILVSPFKFISDPSNKYLFTLKITDGKDFDPETIKSNSAFKTLKTSLKTSNINLTTGDTSTNFSNTISPVLKDTTTWSVDFDGLFNYINTQKALNNNTKTLLSKEIAQTKAETLTSSYGMVPTIYNLNKVMLAHLETLMYSIGACARDAAIVDRGTWSNGTDLKEDKLSPFPWITDIDGKDKYIGDYDAFPYFAESIFVKSFIEAKTDVSKEIG